MNCLSNYRYIYVSLLIILGYSLLTSSLYKLYTCDFKSVWNDDCKSVHYNNTENNITVYLNLIGQLLSIHMHLTTLSTRCVLLLGWMNGGR